jgi:hypothetical protein
MKGYDWLARLSRHFRSLFTHRDGHGADDDTNRAGDRAPIDLLAAAQEDNRYQEIPQRRRPKYGLTPSVFSVYNNRRPWRHRIEDPLCIESCLA